MPIASVVIPLLNSLAKILISVGQAFASFMARLFGVGDSWKDITMDFGDIGDGADFSGMADLLEDGAESADNISSGLGDSEKKAKEVKKQLMGIDEINNLTLPTDDSSSSSSGGSSAGGYTPNLEWNIPTTPDPGPMLDELTAKIEKKLKDAFKPLKDSYDKYMPSIWSNLTSGFNNIASIGKDAFNIISENWEQWAGSASDLFFSLLNTATTVFNGITIILKGVWDSGGSYLFEQLGNLLSSIMRFATTVNDYIVQPFIQAFNVNIAPVIGEFVGGALKTLGDKISEISGWFDQFSEDIKTVFGTGKNDADEFNSALDRIKEKCLTLTVVAGGLLLVFNFSSVIGGVLALGNAFGTLVGFVVRVVTFVPAVMNFISAMGGLSGIATQITTSFSTLGTSLSGLINPFTLIAAAIVGLVAGFAYLYTTSETFRNQMNSIFSDIANNVGGAINGLVEIVKTIWDEGVGPVIDSLVAGFQYLWDNGLSELIENVSMFIGNLINTVMSIWNNAINPLINLILTIFLPIFTSAFDAILAVALPIISKIMEYVNMFIEVLNVILDVLNESVLPVAKVVFNGIADAIKTFFNFAKPIFDNFLTIVGSIVSFLVDVFMFQFKIVFSTIVAVVKAIAEPIKTVINGVKNILQGIIDFVLGVFTGDWGRAWEGVKSIFSGIFDSLKGIVSAVWNAILALFSNGGKIFSGVVEGIGKVFKNIVNSIFSAINKVIRVPFDIINGLLNSIREIDIPIVGKPFKGLWKKNPLPVPQIPKLASGGIAYGDTLVQVAEYVGANTNPEVISPLNDLNGIVMGTMKQVLREEQSQTKPTLNTQSNSQENRIVNASFYFDKRIFYRAMVQEDKKERRNIGKSPLGNGV